MADINTNGYILVKDKEGQMKYYKDGVFFSVEEIAAIQAAKEKTQIDVKQKVVLEPIYTLDNKVAPRQIDPNSMPQSTADHFSDITLTNNLADHRATDQKLIEARVGEIIAKLKIEFGDDKIKSRFVNVLTTYFRGIRTKKEIEYILALPRLSGGLELTPDKISIVMPLLEMHAEELNKARRVVASEAKEKIGQVVDLQHRLEPPPPSTIVYNSGHIMKDAAASAVRPAPLLRPLPSAPPLQSIVPPPVSVKGAIVPRPMPAAQSQTVKPSLNQPIAEVKSRVIDISGGSQLIGPIEELGQMTLGDFRQLGKKREEIIDEMLEKIQLLADQSLVKKLAGIKAWRTSPIFRMYLGLSLEGIREKRTIEQMIEKKQMENSDVLTLSEFETINKLNQMLNM